MDERKERSGLPDRVPFVHRHGSAEFLYFGFFPVRIIGICACICRSTIPVSFHW